MSYKVVCIKQFAGLQSNNQISNTIQIPIVDAIYTCIDERIDGMGMHSLILAELNHKGGYNSEFFAPIDGAGIRSNMIEQPVENAV